MQYHLARFRNWHLPTRRRDLLLIVSGLALRILVGGLYGLSPWAWEIVPLQGIHFSYAGTDGHLQIGRSLMTCGAYAYCCAGCPPVHNRPPLPPLLMAFTAAQFPQHWYPVWLLTTTGLHLGLLLLAVWLARMLRFAPTRRHWLLGLLAFHPNLVLAVRPATYLTPALVLLLLWCVLLVAVVHARPGTPRLWVAGAVGLVSGLLALTHGSMQFFPVLGPGYVVWLLGPHQPWGQRLKLGGLSLGLALLTLTPWLIWNQQTFGRVVPLYSGLGIQYWIKEAELFGPRQLERQVFHQATGRTLALSYYGPQQLADEALLRQLAWADIRANPLKFAGRTALGLLLYWFPWSEGVAKSWIQWPISLLTLGGLLWVLRRCRRFDRMDGVFWLPCLLLWGIFAVFSGQVGYFQLLLPLLASWSVWRLPRLGPGSR